jgi:hypothetical protein
MYLVVQFFIIINFWFSEKLSPCNLEFGLRDK